jgi:hypothetical protein
VGPETLVLRCPERVGHALDPTILNFRAPAFSREDFTRGPDLLRIYENCSRNKHKLKMQQILSKINNKIQNYSHKSSIVDENPEIYFASDFTTHQWF